MSNRKLQAFLVAVLALMLPAAAVADNVAKVGDVAYETLREAIQTAADANTNVVVDLTADAVLDITAWDGAKNTLSIGKDNTETITINGNGHTLTFDQKNSDWNNVATMNDARTVLTLNNMSITNSGCNDGPWNRHDINFNCAVVLNSVTSDKALAFKNSATLKDVTITETGSVYAIWISPRTEGQKVEIDGLSVKAERGIKVDDQYVDNATDLSLDIRNSAFETTKKAAILVKSSAKVAITASNLDITKVAADSENAVWVDEDKAADYGNVMLTSSDVTMAPEGGTSAYEAAIIADGQPRGYYKTLAAAIAAVQAGETVKLLNDINLETSSLTIDKALTLDGQEHALSSDAAQAILLKGNGAVKLENVNITASAGHGVQAGDDTGAYAGALSLNGSTLTVAKRGIRVYKEDTGFSITVANSTIQSNVADPTTTYTTGNDAMALSLGTTDGKGYAVNITNSVLQGFSYDINSVTSGSNLTVTMTGGKTYGRAALNVWGSNNVFTLDGVEVHGLNNQTGPTEAFSCIVENTGASNNTYNINGVTFIAKLSEAAINAAGSSATEQMIDLRGTGATLKITGNTTYSINEGAESRGGLFYNEGAIENASAVLVDATAKANLEQYIHKAEISSEPDENGLYALTYTSEVYYYWIVSGAEEGGNYNFAEPFINGWLADGEFIRLKKDITLTEDVACQLTSGSFTLTFGDFTVTKGDYAVKLNNGVSVKTDKQTDIFAPAAEGFKVVETAEDGGYTYTVKELETTDMDIVLVDGEAYTYTADTEVKSAAFVRKFPESVVNIYLSWFVPFDYTITAEDANKFEFYKINMIANAPNPGVSEESDKVWIYINKMEVGDVLRGNMPYLFKPLEAAADGYEFKADNAVLKAKNEGVLISTETMLNKYSFYGTYNKVTLSSNDAELGLYMGNKGSLSFPETQSVNVGAYRWIIRVSSKSGIAYVREFHFVDGSESTGVRNVTSESETESFYTLDGVKVEAPAKGIYVMKRNDGTTKKVLFK